MPAFDVERFREIRTLPSLIAYLRDELGWPIDQDAVEDDLTFDYEPEELGISAEHAVAIKDIKQIRPLDHRQPWGIFWVNFEKKRIPVVMLRRILGNLVVSKRAGADRAKRKAWHLHDLLFISSYGEADERAVTFAHFSQDPDNPGDLPTLKVLGWDGADTVLHLGDAHETLASKLRWPADPSDTPAWRAQWAGAFRHRLGHTIRTANDLAEVLAALSRGIRDRCKTILARESARGPLTKLFKAFQAALIHDLTPETFADTYAQTITYGLLTAAINRTDMSGGKDATYVKADDLTLMVRVTSPFLKEMLETFLTVGGRKNGMDFDELGIQDVVELLRGDDTDLPAILRDFGNRTRGEDPVIHFYEHFLSAYNKKLKIQRGVFYTPQPVVSYIVRSVHELLQTEFGLEDGLASTVTWGEMIKKNPDLKLPPLTDELGEKRTVSPDEPFVQILDPATGTATFLVEVIDVIHKTELAKFQSLGKTATEFSQHWNDYVPRHLLPRLHGYELLAAPYAIAHLKLGLKLTETGYRFGSPESARIYLTNTLEPKVKQLPAIGFDPLAHEAGAVNEIKWYKRFTVVIGNPPYAGHSVNNQIPWIVDKVYDYKRGLPDLQKPGQAKWLQDDYVKFIRLGQSCIDTASVGIMGYITNHSYLDNPTFRGMRRDLMRSFRLINTYDLHGSSKKKERAPSGEPEENVFDIQQGVAIFLGRASTSKEGSMCHADAWGSRRGKYDRLADSAIPSTKWAKVEPSQPFFLFVPEDKKMRVEYDCGWRVPDIFSENGDPAPGAVTTHDEFAVAFTRAEIISNVESLLASVNEAEAREKFRLCSQSQWNYGAAKRELSRSDWRGAIVRISYRPFDARWTVFNRHVAVHRRERVMNHMLEGSNLALITARANRSPEMDHFFCSRLMSETKCGESTIQSYLLPLYLFPMESHQRTLAQEEVRPNLGRGFLEALASKFNLDQAGTHGLPNGVTPEDIFHYAYAVFHSPTYRTRYAEFLKIDFPRLPLISSLAVFRALARLGGELVALHLMESPKLDKHVTKWIGGKRPEVEKVSYADGVVWVDKVQSEGFRGVPEDVWNFHIGGYQVCEKWLKDRKGRRLTADDITHYHRIVVALKETIGLMSEIDNVIEKHGGWPGAFAATTEGTK